MINSTIYILSKSQSHKISKVKGGSKSVISSQVAYPKLRREGSEIRPGGFFFSISYWLWEKVPEWGVEIVERERRRENGTGCSFIMCSGETSGETQNKWQQLLQERSFCRCHRCLHWGIHLFSIPLIGYRDLRFLRKPGFMRFFSNDGIFLSSLINFLLLLLLW